MAGPRAHHDLRHEPQADPAKDRRARKGGLTASAPTGSGMSSLMVFAVHDLDYLDLDLLIERSGSDYQVRVLSSLAGHRRCVSCSIPGLQIGTFC